MDIEKLFNKLIEDENIKDIPVMYLLRVATVVFELINSGEFYYENE